MDTKGKELGLLGLIARGLSLILICYWALFAVLAPMEAGDSQRDNPGRPLLSAGGGQSRDPASTGPRPSPSPPAFDPIELPFVRLGWGFGIPNFLCLVGTLVVTWSLLRREHDPTTAWMGCLALMGLPPFVFEGVGTNNDLPILFGLAAWLHALIAWRDSRRSGYLVLCALALGFTSGAKVSGIVPAGLCGMATLVMLRRSPIAAITFSAALLTAVVFLASGKIQVEPYLRHLGLSQQPAAVRARENPEGGSPTLTNAIHYATGNLAFSLSNSPATDWINSVSAQWSKRPLGAPATGYHAGREIHPDKNGARIPDVRFDSCSPYGPWGTAGILVLLGSLFWWRPAELWWRLSIFACVNAAFICTTVVWMPWNNRFMLLPFALLVVSVVSLVRQYTGHRQWPVYIVAIASGYTAIAAPLLSFSKKPTDLVNSVFHRQNQQFKERPSMEAVMAAVIEWRATHPDQRLTLFVGSDSWVSPFFLNQKLNPSILVDSDALSPELREARYPGALLVLNRPDFNPAGLPVTLVQSFPEEYGSALYQYRTAASGARRPQVLLGKNIYADGWTGCYFVFHVGDWLTDTITVDIWNPTPLKRTLSLKSKIETIQVDLAPQLRKKILLKVTEFDSIEGTVAPAYRPGGAEIRELGIFIEIATP